MLGYILSALVAFILFSYSVVWPVIEYFQDLKGLRKYPNLNILSGITDLSFIYEAHKGFRSKALLRAYKQSVVVRIGPNSLSYSDILVIKVYSTFISRPIGIIFILDRISMVIIQNVSRTSSTTLWPAPIIIWPIQQIS